MNYKERVVNIRKEIICGIENTMEKVDVNVALLFTDCVNSTTFIDRVCGESFYLSGIEKDADGDLYIFSADPIDKVSLDELNTEDLGEILDQLNSATKLSKCFYDEFFKVN